MPPAKRLRKSHTKSRLGCQECKRRRIKCDEAHPACINCVNDSRACVYQPPAPRTASQQPSSHARSNTVAPSDTRGLTYTPQPVDTPRLSGTPSTAAAPGVDLTSQLPAPLPIQTSVFSPSTTDTANHGLPCSTLNIRHIQLFSHFILETLPSLDDTNTTGSEHVRLLMPAAVSEPYVVYQLLAFSAMHMSHTHAAEAERHRAEAKALQTQAVCLFNVPDLVVTMENCVPMMIFSSFLGLHALADATASVGADTRGTLDKFLTYISLHRGVRAIMAQSWQFLKHSSMFPVLDRAARSMSAESSSLHEEATVVSNRLRALLDHADMNATSASACREAVSQLGLVYQTEPIPGGLCPKDQPSGLIWSWPILLSSVFTDLLLMRRPETLVILCHYAVLLHRRRRMWLVGNIGQMLIEEVSKFLGTFWQGWLEWPNAMLAQQSCNT